MPSVHDVTTAYQGLVAISAVSIAVERARSCASPAPMVRAIHAVEIDRRCDGRGASAFFRPTMLRSLRDPTP